MITTAKLIALKSDDGLFEVQEGVAIGTEYLVDTDTRAFAVMVHKSGIVHHKEIIFEYPHSGGWLPVCLLEIGDKSCGWLTTSSTRKH